MGVQIVADLPQALTLRQQHHETLDRWGEGGEVGSPGLGEESHQLGMLPEMVALGFQNALQSLQGSAIRRRQTGEGLFELGSDLTEDRVKEAAYRGRVPNPEAISASEPRALRRVSRSPP